MSKLRLLKTLMAVKENDLKNLDEEQLRLMLGVFRYSVRTVEREINGRGLIEGNVVSKKGKL